MAYPEYRLDDLTRSPTTPSKRRRSHVGLLVAALVVVVLAVAGVLVYLLGVRDSTGGGSSGPPIAGCAVASTEELDVQSLYSCPDGTRVVTFASEQARDDYLKIAEHFGAVVVEKGSTWARIRA
jgi:hypothetical protein